MIKKILMFIVIYLGVDCIVSAILGATGLIVLLANPIFAIGACIGCIIIAAKIMKRINRKTTSKT